MTHKRDYTPSLNRRWALTRVQRSIDIQSKPKNLGALLYWDQLPGWLDLIETGTYTSAKRTGIGTTAHVRMATPSITVTWYVETTHIERQTVRWRTTPLDAWPMRSLHQGG